MKLLGEKWDCNDKTERGDWGVCKKRRTGSGPSPQLLSHSELFVLVLALGCFPLENGRKECAGNFNFFFFSADSYRSGKIIQTDLSSNSFCFQAVSKFPVKKRNFVLKKKSNYIAVQNLVLSQSCICRLKTAWSCPLGLCNTVENQKVKDQAEYKKEINPWGYTCSPQDINTVVLPNWSSWRSFTSFPSPLL